MEKTTENANHLEKRLLLIEAFYRCATRDGLRKATNRVIAKEANVPLGILHYYFKDRAEMIEALVKWVADTNIEKYRTAVENVSTSEAAFRKAFEFLFITMMDDSDGSLFYDLWSESKRNPEIKKSFAYMYRAYRKQVADQSRELGLSQGLSDEELYSLASLLIGMNEGVLLQWDIDREHVNPEEIARIAGEMVHTFFELRSTRESGN